MRYSLKKTKRYGATVTIINIAYTYKNRERSKHKYFLMQTSNGKALVAKYEHISQIKFAWSRFCTKIPCKQFLVGHFIMSHNMGH